jgi:hypothetical protein
MPRGPGRWSGSAVYWYSFEGTTFERGRFSKFLIVAISSMIAGRASVSESRRRPRAHGRAVSHTPHAPVVHRVILRERP